MRKISYYNVEDVENELQIFINIKNEITFYSQGYGYPDFSISLSKEDIDEMIIDLQKLSNEIL
jgi:hypothetical protein